MAGLSLWRIKKEKRSQRHSKPSSKKTVNHNIYALTKGKNIITNSYQRMKELLQKHNITLYSTENEEKSSVCERRNRTIKTKIWKQFIVQGNTQYLDVLLEILEQYNNTKNSFIKMTPVEAASKKKNESTVYMAIWNNCHLSPNSRWAIKSG